MRKYDNELHAMKVCALAMKKLTFAERRRVLAWLQDAVLEYSDVIPPADMTEIAE